MVGLSLSPSILAMMATEHLMPYTLSTSCKLRRNLVGYY